MDKDFLSKLNYLNKFVDVYYQEFINIIWFIVFLIFIYIFLLLIFRLLLRTTIKLMNSKYTFQYERIVTIFDVLKLIIRFLLILILFFYIFSQFKVNVSALLTGAGALGAILLLIFQNSLKDIFLGWIFVFEDNFRKGETVIINNTFKGKVIDLTFRYLILRLDNGSFMKIPFNKIEIINNLSRFRNISDIVLKIKREKFSNDFIQRLEKGLIEFNDKDKNIEVYLDSNIVLLNNLYEIVIKIKSPFNINRKTLTAIKNYLLENFYADIEELS